MGKLRRSWEDYEVRAREKHGDKYNYSKVVYEGSRKKVEIVCPEHGSFFQTPDNHVNKGTGCVECGWLSIKRARTGNLEHFIKRSTKSHKGKYSYDNSVYVDQSTRVIVTCPFHGDFETVPMIHIKGQGWCPECYKEDLRTRFLLTKEDFLVSAREAHRDKYDYSKVVYVDTKTKVEIVCPNQGSFWQTPESHKSGKGCRECWRDAYGYGVNGYYGTDKPSNLYVWNCDNQFIKVGLSTELERRLKTFKKQSGISNVEVLVELSGKANTLYKLEQLILRQSGLTKHTPTVNFNGKTECLEISELGKAYKIIEEFKNE